MKTDDRFWIKRLEPVCSKGSLVLCRIGLVKALTDKIGPTVFVSRQMSPGDTLEQGSLLYVIESTKAAMDIESPVACEVQEVNSLIEIEPHLVFEDPEGRGWLLEAWLSKEEVVN